MAASHDESKGKEPKAPHATLQDIPREVILHDVLPNLSLDDLLTVSEVDKELNALVNDSTVWKAKTEEDFGYRASALSLAGKDDSAWYKRVYLGLQRPRVFLWGEDSGSRLTSLRGTNHDFGSVVVPADVTDCFTVPSGNERVPVGLVDLQAGGWSFSARDMRGGVWVWGQLNGQGWTRGGWEDAYATVEDPARLPLPCKATAIAQGRLHLLVLDSDNLIWEMRAWGKAYQHTAPQLTAPTQTGTSGPKPHIRQIAAGWEMSAALTETGDIHVWFPFRSDYQESCTPDDEMSGPACIDGVDTGRMLKWGKVTASRDAVQTMERIPVWLESFEMPEWNQQASRFKEEKDAEKVVKIACGRDFIVALKANGEVWLCAANEHQFGQWQIMTHFSLPSITHISAQFSAIVAYSTPTAKQDTGRLLFARVGDILLDVGATLKPETVPGLDELPVVQVVAGDWHWAALTAHGEMYTWGENGHGQLGLGDDESRREVERVRFAAPAPDSAGTSKEEKDEFVFSITAAGMHTGALVLGRKLTKEERDRQKVRRLGRPVEQDEDQPPNDWLNWHRNMPPIRIGFAGRGMMPRGGPRGGPGRGFPGFGGFFGSRGGGPPNDGQ